MTVIESILAVFTAILGWFSDAFNTVVGLFYNAESGLTFVGVVAFMTLGIALFTLVVGWIKGLIR